MSNQIAPTDLKYPCTECGGDAFIGYCARTITRGKNKGKQVSSWDGKVKPGEILCLSCGRKRGIKFF